MINLIIRVLIAVLMTITATPFLILLSVLGSENIWKNWQILLNKLTFEL